VDALKKALTGTDKTVIRTATEDLSRAISKIGETMSKQQQTEEPKKDDNGEEPNVRDAETS